MLANRCTLIGRSGEDKRVVKLVWDDGDVFEGVVEGPNSQLRLVEGSMRWYGGDEFRGEFQNDVMHGRGSYFYSDGRVFAGEFACGVKCGRGLMTDGEDSFRGYWRDDVPHGVGLRVQGQEKHCGVFDMGRCCGWGTRQYSPSGMHLGFWKTVGEREMLEGKAIYVQQDGSRLLEVYKNGKLMNSFALARDLDASLTVTREWQKDADAPNCFICKTVFSLTVRRSHCRNCGQVICAECTKRMKLDGEKSKEEKVCEDCFIVRNSTFDVI